jgi:hypothetical protein
MSEKTKADIIATVDGIKQLLLEKNERYGDSALEPLRLFSRASPIEQLLIRIDDKLSRIRQTGISAKDEDTLLDLIGYQVLLLIAVKRGKFSVAPKVRERGLDLELYQQIGRLHKEAEDRCEFPLY